VNQKQQFHSGLVLDTAGLGNKYPGRYVANNGETMSIGTAITMGLVQRCRDSADHMVLEGTRMSTRIALEAGRLDRIGFEELMASNSWDKPAEATRVDHVKAPEASEQDLAMLAVQAIALAVRNPQRVNEAAEALRALIRSSAKK